MPDTMELVADPMRREILRRIWDTELPVNVLVDAFDVTQPAVSFHLRLPREGGLGARPPAGQSALLSRRAGGEPGPDQWHTGSTAPTAI